MRFEWKTEFVQRRKTYFLFLAKTRASWSTNFHHRKVMEGTSYWEKLKINFQVNITSRFTFQKNSLAYTDRLLCWSSRAQKKYCLFEWRKGQWETGFPFDECWDCWALTKWVSGSSLFRIKCLNALEESRQKVTFTFSSPKRRLRHLVLEIKYDRSHCNYN